MNKRVARTITTIVLVTVAVTATACTSPVESTQSAAVTSTNKAVTAYLIVDGHGLSDANVTIAKGLVARIIRKRVGGAGRSVFYLGIVTAHSYPAAVVMTIVVPSLPMPRPCLSPWGMTCRHLDAERTARIHVAQAAVQHQLAAFITAPVPRSGHDDLPGALYEGRELFAGAPKSRHVLVVVGAFIPSPAEKTTLTLPGVEANMVVVPADADTTTTTLVHRAAWIRALRHYGVHSIQAWDPAEDIVL